MLVINFAILPANEQNRVWSKEVIQRMAAMLPNEADGTLHCQTVVMLEHIRYER